ncbi:transglutaminase-like domain-containing protein [Paludisphaera soli]|uniref:transglutaminase-like domain-containing protein n=1 Tax=Paludisphaera soli TaxID=2712865 RepID=UPI0013EB68CE|nr:transglutaminase-like domain-containing protein [Paludisphaera soli]
MPAWYVVGLVAAFAYPTFLAIFRAAWTGRPGPMELALLASLRNLTLGLAAMSHRGPFARLAALTSLFLILASSSKAEGPLVVGLVAGYSVAGAVWLVLLDWRGCLTPVGPAGRRPSPALAIVSAFSMIGLGVAVVAAGPTRVAVALAGLFPSSGGTDWDDPDALGGVNDGANEVKGSTKPESIGFTDSDVYLKSDRPSLYDAFNDMYGEPVKPKKVDRMVSIDNKNIASQKEAPAENLRAGREFAAVRRREQRQADRPPVAREADALLYVKGPTPLHLPLTAYDRFDGRDWSEAPPRNLSCPLVAEDRGGPWFRLDRPITASFAGPVHHQIKIGKLDSSPLPMPPHLVAFRVGAVNRADFFDSATEGLIRMVGRTVPSGTVIDTEAHALDPERLRRCGFAPYEPTDDEPRCATARDLARRWTVDRPQGWPRVEAIVRGLRRHAVLDPDATAPADCPDVVEHFLTSGRGPDYLFASAAVVMLRQTGQQARLVSGLYARPAAYDPPTRHTPVTGQDVHVWAEALGPGGVWITVEPTPGYETTPPPLDFRRAVMARLRAAWERVASHPWTSLLAASLLLAALRHRLELADAAATFRWRIGSRGEPRDVVLRTIGLLEARARLGGAASPNGQTLRGWYGPIGVTSDGQDGDLARLMGLADWGLYAPVDAEPPEVGEGGPPAACRRALRNWTLKRFRAHARSVDGRRTRG